MRQHLFLLAFMQPAPVSVYRRLKDASEAKCLFRKNFAQVEFLGAQIGLCIHEVHYTSKIKLFNLLIFHIQMLISCR